MYLNVPSSDINPTDLQLMFNFVASGTSTRSWNIKIAMLPCGASYLGSEKSSYQKVKKNFRFLNKFYFIAPPDCLQYFTAATGSVSSFNWKVGGLTNSYPPIG